MESVGRGTTKMPQFCLQLAGLSVSVASQYSQVEHMCSGYEVPKGASSDIDVRIDPQDIDAERDEGAWSDAYLETLAVYRQIAEALPAFDRMLVHGALLSFQGEGYLFAAPSGTGKSSHALLWKRFLGDAVSIVNGDKPIVRLTGEGDVPVAYGTPWAGKEGWHENASVPLPVALAGFYGKCICRSTAAPPRARWNCRTGWSDAFRCTNWRATCRMTPFDAALRR